MTPKLLFKYNTLADFCEYHARGYRGDVVAVIDNAYYELCFFDHVRLNQSLESEPIFGIPSLIIIPEITPEYLNAAVAHLHRANFFRSFKEQSASSYKDYKEPDFDIEDPENKKWFEPIKKPI